MTPEQRTVLIADTLATEAKLERWRDNTHSMRSRETIDEVQRLLRKTRAALCETTATKPEGDAA